MKFAVEKAKACLLILVMTYFTEATQTQSVQKKSSSATLQRDKKGENFSLSFLH
jgi:hypothetical protein